MTRWLGTWRNQYGSELEITGEADGRLEGRFRTALPSSPIYGQAPAIVGVHRGDLVAFSVAGGGEKGSIAVAYTGMLTDGKLETLWHLVASERLAADAEGAPAERRPLEWWQAMTTSADTFERVGP